MACGGAFYMLGEVEFIIAADHATFFDPHVTYGMVAAFEPIHMSGIMPFGEIMRLSLMGNYERTVGAAGARDRNGVGARTRRRAGGPCPRGRVDHRVAAPARHRRNGARASGARASTGNARRSASGTRTSRWARAGSRSPRVRNCSSPANASSGNCGSEHDRRAPRSSAPHSPTSDGSIRRRRSSCTSRPRAAPIADAGLTKADIDGFASSGMGLLAPVEVAEYLGLRPTWVDGTGVGGSTWEFMVEHATAAILAGHVEVVVLVYGSTARADLKARRREREPLVRRARAGAVGRAVRPHADLQVRDGRAPPHARVRHHDRATRRDLGVEPLQRVAEPRGVLPRPDHDRRRADARE